MKIIVLNGSPKGMLSATLHYVFFLQKKFPEHEFQIIHVCDECERLERDRDAFDAFLHTIRGADGVLWSFPVFTFLVQAYFKRFIELIFARGAQDAFRDKHAATLSTSIHFFDHTAHNYVHGICDDWGMRFVAAFSASVYDLLVPKERERLLDFARGFLTAIARQSPVARCWEAVHWTAPEYAPAAATNKVALGARRAVILMDSASASPNLLKMVERFAQCFDGRVEQIDLGTVRIACGCDGCFQCGRDGRCALRDRDDINGLYLDHLAPADIIVMAGTIVDRYLSWRWKLFYDRGFFMPLIPWWPGKQLAYLVSGPLRQLPNLREILTGYTEFHLANLAGIVTDESRDSAETDRLLDQLAQRLVDAAACGYRAPQTFLGIGGTKVFRDELWGFLRPVFQVGHRHYRSHGMYDFPQNRWKNWLLITAGMLFVRLPGVRERFHQSLKHDVIAPLKKFLAKQK